jgi:pimeloyl-ACP methyl ester carboxylesterase
VLRSRTPEPAALERKDPGSWWECYLSLVDKAIRNNYVEAIQMKIIQRRASRPSASAERLSTDRGAGGPLQRRFTESDFRPELRRVLVPTLLVDGDNDGSTPIETTARKTVPLIPGGQLSLLFAKFR